MSKALLVIDVQRGIMDAVTHADEVLAVIGSLAQRARAAGASVIHVQHNDSLLATNSPAWQIHPVAAPQAGEPVVQKWACDSFHETSLHDELQRRGVTHLVMAGCQTDFCIDSTCRRAVTLGYEVTLAEDGHTTEDSPTLSARQIIAHHNWLLNGFGTREHPIRVVPSSNIEFEPRD